MAKIAPITDLYQHVKVTRRQRQFILDQVVSMSESLELDRCVVAEAMLLSLRRWQGDHGMFLAQGAATMSDRVIWSEVVRNFLERVADLAAPNRRREIEQALHAVCRSHEERGELRASDERCEGPLLAVELLGGAMDTPAERKGDQ